MRDLFIYARARFEQCEKLSGPQGSAQCLILRYNQASLVSMW